MPDREKKLLTIACIVGFIILNLVGFSFAKSQRIQVDADRKVATDKLALMQDFLSKSEQVTEEMDWLKAQTFENKPAQTVQSQLLGAVEAGAASAGLKINNKELSAADTSGKHYHRAKVTFKVTGSETGLYDWLERLNDPTLFRHATKIVLKPTSGDDSKIDCEATIEQWFIPQTQ